LAAAIPARRNAETRPQIKNIRVNHHRFFGSGDSGQKKCGNQAADKKYS
jgi:hypothetical protein